MRKGVGGRIWWKYYVLVYKNGKMRPGKLIQDWGEGHKGECWSR
jgi:hypothetical protein